MSDTAPNGNGNGNGNGRKVTAEWLFRSLSGGLLLMVVYFLSDVHADLKKQASAISDLRTEVLGKLNTTVSNHETRLNKLEDWRTSHHPR